MLKSLESEFREWHSSLEICFIKGVCMQYVLWKEGCRDENTKSLLLLQGAVFFLRYHSFSGAHKATPVYIILKEL